LPLPWNADSSLQQVASPSWSSSDAAGDRVLAAASYHFYHGSGSGIGAGAGAGTPSSSFGSSNSNGTHGRSQNGSERVRRRRRPFAGDRQDIEIDNDDTRDQMLANQFAEKSSMLPVSRRLMEDDEWEDEWGSEINFMMNGFAMAEQRPSYIL